MILTEEEHRAFRQIMHYNYSKAGILEYVATKTLEEVKQRLLRLAPADRSPLQEKFYQALHTNELDNDIAVVLGWC